VAFRKPLGEHETADLNDLKDQALEWYEATIG
jgi:hypothetical protein